MAALHASSAAAVSRARALQEFIALGATWLAVDAFWVVAIRAAADLATAGD